MNFARLLMLTASLSCLVSCTITESEPDVVLRQADQLYQAGEFSQAENFYKSPSVMANSDLYKLAALLGLARCFLKEGKNVEAVNTCRRAQELCDALYGADERLKASILMMKSQAEERLGQYGQATVSIGEAIELVPDANYAGLVLPLLRLADIEYKTGNFSEAAKLYESIFRFRALVQMADR